MPNTNLNPNPNPKKLTLVTINGRSRFMWLDRDYPVVPMWAIRRYWGIRRGEGIWWGGSDCCRL